MISYYDASNKLIASVERAAAFDTNAKLTAVKIGDVTTIVVEGNDVLEGYDVTIANGGQNATMTVRLLIGEEFRSKDDLKVFFIDENGVATDMNAERDGDYMVFSADRLSQFVITCTAEGTTSLVWLIGVMAGVLALGAVMVVIRFVMAKKSRKAAKKD